MTTIVSFHTTQERSPIEIGRFNEQKGIVPESISLRIAQLHNRETSINTFFGTRNGPALVEVTTIGDMLVDKTIVFGDGRIGAFLSRGTSALVEKNNIVIRIEVV